MPEPLVRLERDDHVAVLTFHDPEHRNAMTRAMGEACAERVAELAADPDLRAVVLTGAGGAFSAGGDLAMIEGRAAEGREGGEASRARIRDGMRDFYGLFLAIRDLPCPTLAAVNGHAIGAGLCVALACDVRVAAREAKLGLNFARLGLHPGMGATWALPRLVGPARAAELLMTGRTVTGAEAEAMGLVSRALPAAEVLPATREIAAEMAACAPAAVRGIKRSLARAPLATLSEQLDLEAAEQARCFQSEDVLEGLAAARERRPPKFQGR